MAAQPPSTILAAAAIAASWLGAAPVCLAEAEPAGAPAPPSAAAVFAPRAPETLRGVDGGVRLWIVQQLRRGDIVLSGSVVETQWVAAGDEAVIEIEGLGRARAVFA